ncbi:MAG: branched-chain amino acid ABC transporter permease [Candidatus Absconditicoccaceae bacterium]
MQFAIHIAISAIIFAILTSGFRFFIKLRGTIDFSYLAIVIFASYSSALLNIHFGLGILVSIILSFALSILFTFLVLFLSSKLNDVYFSIGTLALYILAYQLAYNMEGITGGALGLSGISRNLIGSMMVTSLSSYLILSLIILILLFTFLFFFKKSYFYKVLTGRGENEIVVKSLGTKILKYKFVMILITTFLAAVGGGLYTFYYLYIDPSSFRLSMLILLVVIGFISYKYNDRGILFTSMIVMFAYEYLRFFKVVDPSKIGYFREMIFGIIVIIVAFIVFRKTSFGREN